jgi:hypothetical protein
VTQVVPAVNRVLCASALGAALLYASVAHAAPGDGTRLEYARSDRAAACPDRDALQSAVAKRLGYNPFFPAARQTIVVEITDTDSGLRAAMRLVDEHGMIIGSRELSDQVQNCGELVASLALAISIALDPSAALGAAQAADDVAQPATAPKKEATPSEAAPPAPPRREDVPQAAPPVAETRRVPRDFAPAGAGNARPSALRASAFGSLGVAPSAAAGVRLGGGFRANWFELVAEFSDQFAASRDVPGGTARAALLSGIVAPCWAARWFAGCALFDVGSLRTEGQSVQSPHVQRSRYVAAGMRAELDPVLVGPLHALANLDILKSLTPVALRLYGQQVWQTPFVSLAASLGLEVRFP